MKKAVGHGIKTKNDSYIPGIFSVEARHFDLFEIDMSSALEIPS